MEHKTKTKITNTTHVYEMGVAGGMGACVLTLEAVPAQLRQTPGFALALATIKAEAERYRASMTAQNMTALFKAGVDLATIKAVAFDGNTGELISDHYEQDLLSPLEQNEPKT